MACGSSARVAFRCRCEGRVAVRDLDAGRTQVVLFVVGLAMPHRSGSMTGVDSRPIILTGRSERRVTRVSGRVLVGVASGRSSGARENRASVYRLPIKDLENRGRYRTNAGSRRDFAVARHFIGRQYPLVNELSGQCFIQNMDMIHDRSVYRRGLPSSPGSVTTINPTGTGQNKCSKSSPPRRVSSMNHRPA